MAVAKASTIRTPCENQRKKEERRRECANHTTHDDEWNSKVEMRKNKNMCICVVSGRVHRIVVFFFIFFLPQLRLHINQRTFLNKFLQQMKTMKIGWLLRVRIVLLLIVHKRFVFVKLFICIQYIIYFACVCECECVDKCEPRKCVILQWKKRCQWFSIRICVE